jgi:replication factor A1
MSEYKTKIGELRTYSRRVNLVAKILNIGEPREVTSSSNGRFHQVAEALIGDSTGTVILTLWDDYVEKFNEGDVIELENGYAGTFRGRLRLNIGKYGNAEKVDMEFNQIETENNMSEKDLGSSYQRRHR